MDGLTSREIMMYIRRNNFVEITRLVDKNGVNFLYEGETLLHLAIREGKYRMVELLLKEGANPNERNKKGLVPLHYSNIMDLISLNLIDSGADINALDNEKCTALDIVILKAHKNLSAEMYPISKLKILSFSDMLMFDAYNIEECLKKGAKLSKFVGMKPKTNLKCEGSQYLVQTIEKARSASQ